MAARTKKPKRARTVRREADRDDGRARDERLALARLVPGGSPQRPLEVTTAALVEATARAGGCPACGGEVRVDDHAAETVDGRLLRAVRLACVACGARTVRWVVVLPSRLN